MIYVYCGLNIHKTSFIRVKCTDATLWKIKDGNVFIPMKARTSLLIDGRVHPQIAVQEHLVPILLGHKNDDIIILSCTNEHVLSTFSYLIYHKKFDPSQLKIVLLNEDSTGVLFEGTFNEDGFIDNGWPFDFFLNELVDIRQFKDV